RNTSAERRSRARAAGRGDGRATGERAGGLRRDPRLAGLEGRQLRARLDRVGRADALRRAAARWQGIPRGVAADRGRAVPALELATRPARGRPAPLCSPTFPGRRRTGHAAGVSEPEQPDAEELPAPPPPPLIGAVAIIGFPNVGKSTLVNRLTETRAAVVH